MQKRANRILSALIVLVMVLSMLPATVFATGETENVLEGWNISLGENIGVKFYLNSADYTVTTTVNGAEVTPVISGKVVTVNVAAAQMNDPIVLTVKNGDETVHTDEYSVREYAETILGGEYDDYVKDMVKEMLNYGAAAQTYFDYNADNLANAGYELESSAEVPTEVPAITVEDNLAGISLYGMSLVFRNKTAVRFYFNVSGDIADYTFSQGTPVEKDGMYYVEVGDINPQDLANDITLKVNDGALSVTYSPLNYIVRKYNNAESSESLKDLVQAMYGYHLEAKYYNSVVPVGALQSSGHGWSTGGIYATMPENDAYFVQDDWGIEYTPVSADVIKLVRAGETTSVGMPGQGTLIKFTATDYYLKTENHTISGEVLPLQDQDYLIVEGRFVHNATGSVMYISKTYIYNNGGTLEFSTTEPVLPVSYDVGVLQAHNAGAGGSGIYFTTQEANDAPDGDWNTYYDSASVDNVKLIRNGETVSVGLTDRNTICKFGANDYYLRLEEYTIGEYAPFTAADMFIVEGAFTHVNSKTTLNIAKTYIYHDGSAWVFSATEPVYEPETVSPFTFDKGVYSSDIFNNRNNGLSVSVENQQLKLQQPEGAANWLWIKQDMPAGTVVTMDVTFSGEGMSIFGYGSKENGDPITEGAVTESVPQGWFWGQGGSASGSYTFNIYEDCYGLSLMLGFANSTETAIYIDNVVIMLPPETESPFTFDGGSFSADIFNNRNNGLSVSVENQQLKLQQPAGAANWLWIKQTMKAGTTVTMDVTFSGDGMNIFGYGSKANGDPITEGTVTESVPQGWFWGQGGSESGSYTFTIYEDCYGLSLMLGFANSTETAIYIDNVVITAPEVEEPIVVSGGNMTENADGWDAAGDIFFTLAENAIPVDENAEIEYTAETGVIKLVRGGTTYDMVGTVVKYDTASYYLSLEGSQNLPLQNKDYLVVEGNFVNADDGYTLNISKTYILVDGENLIYSTTEPEVKLTYEVGVLNSHGAGVASGDNGIKGIYATSIATDATSGDWSYEYTPVASENYKLIRDGVTYNVGRPGEGTLVMFGQTEYYLKQESNTFDSSLLPLQKGDILVLEGNWSCNQDVASVITIDTTYILIVGESAVKFSAEMPDVVKINVLKESQNGRGNGFYATADSNSAPLNTDWSLRYKAQSADAVKYVSNGVTSNVANTEAEMLVKYTEYDYYFEGWTLGGTFANIAAGDMYIVDGLFYNAANNVYIDIDTTYIQFTADDELFSSTEPVPEVIHQIGVLAESGNGTRVDSTSGTVTGIYAVAEVNDAPYGDWNVEYTPANASGLKLVRDGVTYNVGVTGSGTIVKFTESDYFVKLEGHTIKFSDGTSVLPMQDGDMLIIEGNWVQASDATVKVNFAKTYILLDGTKAVISDTEPAIIPVYEVGVLAPHSAGVNVDATAGIKGIYATCTATEATFDTEWTVEYTPVSTENYKLIRGGVTYNVGQPGAGTLVLFSQTDIYLKQESHTFTSSLLPVQDGDILVLEGEWSCNQDANSIINITKTYISISGNSAVFSAEDPRIINVGTMYAHDAGYSTSGDGNISGIYFMNAVNAVPANEDWSVRYAATDASNVKLIRGGTTQNIAVVGANTIVKMSDQAGWLCLENAAVISTYPIMAGDILVVEGAFHNSSNGYTMVIDKTYIVVGSDGVSFTTQYEETDYGTVVLPTFVDTLTIGTWAGSYHHFTDERLSELKKAGITKILGVNPAYVGSENNNDVSVLLDRCAKFGISVVIDLRDWDGSTVPVYANHPNLIGFLMYDEPNASKFDDIAALKAKFDAVMPADKLFYVNLFPECAADSSLVSGWNDLIGKDDYDENYVTEFLNAMDIEVLSWDNYSLLEGSGIRTDYYHNFEVMASKNLPLWYTMLSAGHGTTSATYATPTAAELRWQMAVAMTYGVQNIDHYVYYSHETNYSCMLQCVDDVYSTTALYNDILAVDNEYLSWDNIFMAYDWKGVAGVRAGSSSTMLDMLENNINLSSNGLAGVSTTQDVLVGVFDYNGEKAYMVTNAGSAGTGKVGDGKSFTMTDATVTLTLADADYKCVAIIDQGVISYVAVENNTVTIPVSAYEGVFVIPVLN